MRRRTLLSGLAAGVLAGCSTAGPGRPTAPAAAPSLSASPSPSAAAAAEAPVLGSTGRSLLAPRRVTPFVPAGGTAPGRRLPVRHADVSFSRDDRPLPVRVWYPEGSGPFPLVVFSHGLTSEPGAYLSLLEAWAAAGIVVAAPTYPHTHHGAADLDAGDIVNQPADASFVLTELLGLRDGPLAGRLDATRLGAAGHSAGGITTAGLFSAARDDRLKVGVVLAGTDFRNQPFAGPPAALLFVHGRNDTTVRYGAAHTVLEAVPWSRAMLTVTNGGHVSTAAEARVVADTTTEFLRWALYGDPAAKSRIPGAAGKGKVATLEDQL